MQQQELIAAVTGTGRCSVKVALWLQLPGDELSMLSSVHRHPRGAHDVSNRGVFDSASLSTGGGKNSNSFGHLFRNQLYIYF